MPFEQIYFFSESSYWINKYLDVGADAQTRPHVILFDGSRELMFVFPFPTLAASAFVALTAAHWKHWHTKLSLPQPPP